MGCRGVGGAYLPIQCPAAPEGSAEAPIALGGALVGEHAVDTVLGFLKCRAFAQGVWPEGILAKNRQIWLGRMDGHTPSQTFMHQLDRISAIRWRGWPLDTRPSLGPNFVPGNVRAEVPFPPPAK